MLILKLSDSASLRLGVTMPEGEVLPLKVWLAVREPVMLPHDVSLGVSPPEGEMVTVVLSDREKLVVVVAVRGGGLAMLCVADSATEDEALSLAMIDGETVTDVEAV